MPGYTFVLGSGGVKSIAGLGAMAVFEQEGLLPKAVVGCSAGAIFGALIAAGHPCRRAITMATTLWSRELTSQRKPRALLQLALPRVAGFNEHFALRDDRLILQRLHDAFGTATIESLPLPLRIQTTCAHSGEGVVLSQGHLVAALRASMALPFLFAPQPLGGRLLVDGSLSDPLPLSAAPADNVVVGLGFKVPHPQHLGSVSRLATRVTATLSNNLLASRNATAAQHKLVLMMPTLQRRVGLFDTDAMPYLLDLGRQAALQALPRLRLLLQAEAQPHTNSVSPAQAVRSEATEGAAAQQALPAGLPPSLQCASA